MPWPRRRYNRGRKGLFSEKVSIARMWAVAGRTCLHYFRMQQKGHARASRREIMLNKTTSLVLMPQLEEDLQVRVKFVTIKPHYREDLWFKIVGDILMTFSPVPDRTRSLAALWSSLRIDYRRLLKTGITVISYCTMIIKCTRLGLPLLHCRLWKDLQLEETRWFSTRKEQGVYSERYF